MRRSALHFAPGGLPPGRRGASLHCRDRGKHCPVCECHGPPMLSAMAHPTTHRRVTTWRSTRPTHLQSGRRVLAVAQRLPAGQKAIFMPSGQCFPSPREAQSGCRAATGGPSEANVQSCAPPNDPATCHNLEKHSAYTFVVLSESPGRCAASSAPLKPISVLSPQCFPLACTRASRACEHPAGSPPRPMLRARWHTTTQRGVRT